MHNASSIKEKWESQHCDQKNDQNCCLRDRY